MIAALGVDLDAAEGFAERVRARIEKVDWSASAPGLRLTACVGVASGPRSRWRGLLSAASDAVGVAKRGGKNAVATAPGKLPPEEAL